MLTEDMRGRLYNWKFADAWNLAKASRDVTVEELELITALASTFGDSGWWGGVGHMGTIVGAALETLGVGDD